MLKRLVLIVVPLVFEPMAFAQDFQKNFDDFQKSTQQEFDDFVSRTNKEFTEFMRKGWEWFEGKDPVPAPVQEDPVVPPVVFPEEEVDKDRDEKEIPYDEVIPEPEPAPVPTPLGEPIEETPAPPVVKWVPFEIYGTKCAVRFNKADRPFLSDLSNNAIADMWDVLVEYEGTELMLYDILTQSKALSLCDWAFYKYVKAFSDALYPGCPPEAGLLHTFIMTQAGFELKIGQNSDGIVYPLMATECDLYDYPYFEVEGRNYYALEALEGDRMKILPAEFPAEMSPMRLTIEQENLFADKLSEIRPLVSNRYPEVSVTSVSNLNLISFMDDYPLAFVNNDMRTKWRFYANVPASHNMRETMYPVLRRAICGKSECESVNILLNFVQTAFEYEYDEEIWGTDRSFFADESLYYPYCDCEDRSILFSRLVRDLMSLDVVLIYYPGHLATAVKFNSEVEGDYISYAGNRYTICDPTYINAPIGVTMPNMDNSSTFVLTL